jgi:metallo-beta-lactamase class B
MTRALPFVLVLALAVPIAVAAQSDRSWREPFDPLKIAGNIYYVGTRGLSSFLIVTPAGGIVIDSGEAESVPFVRANIEKLGFRLTDVRLLLAGHAHFDHVGGHADLKRLTGARVVVMDADRDALESGVDRSALGAQGWKPVRVDRVVKDGETVALGGTTLTARLTPGHTQGCTTWTTETTENGRRLQVAFVCSVTVNDGVRLVGNASVPQIADHYAQAFRVLHGLKPDVFVAEHGEAFGLEAKAQRAQASTLREPQGRPEQGRGATGSGQAGGANPFVDPDGYQRFVERSEQSYLKQLRTEQSKREEGRGGPRHRRGVRPRVRTHASSRSTVDAAVSARAPRRSRSAHVAGVLRSRARSPLHAAHDDAARAVSLFVGDRVG